MTATLKAGTLNSFMSPARSRDRGGSSCSSDTGRKLLSTRWIRSSGAEDDSDTCARQRSATRPTTKPTRISESEERLHIFMAVSEFQSCTARPRGRRVNVALTEFAFPAEAFPEHLARNVPNGHLLLASACAFFISQAPFSPVSVDQSPDS